MDAFYASVELLRYPELRGSPVVIGGRGDPQPDILKDGSRRFARMRNYAGRGVITTATYEARIFGLSSGMGLMKAAEKFETEWNFHTQATRKIFERVRDDL